ncbi:MAG TPA: hypothetical protein IAC64_07395 [Candidatus Caccomorpha excrementavium]|nr:hypothetical protein [Candidatus Caccomorpha excrementavium]
MDQRGIFRKKTMDRISGPEQMNDYIRVSNPAAWMVLAALCILAAAVIVWGFTGRLATTVSAVGVVQNPEGTERIYCYLSYEDASVLEMGDPARIVFRNLPEEEYGYLNGVIREIAATPLSYEEVASRFDYDWLTENLITNTYSVEVVIEPVPDPESENGYSWSGRNGGDAVIINNTLADVTFVTDEVRPVDFLLD